MRRFFTWVWLLILLPCAAAERDFNFGEYREGTLPEGFRSTVMGGGGPGNWKVVLAGTPSAFVDPLTQKPAVAKHAVLAQLSQNPTDERFPLCVWDQDSFGDFTLTTRFQTVRGTAEQMAGIAFRIQNETNYYVVRASSLGNNFRWYKVVNGVRSPLYGPTVPVPAGVWHELEVACKGNQIRCLLDGKQLIPDITDNSFSSGKIGFWTKSDSVSYFGDTKIIYTPREAPAQGLVRRTMEEYPKLLGLKVFVPGKEAGTARLVASNAEADIGKPGEGNEPDVISKGSIYYGKGKGSVTVTLPLKDRNGDPIAAVRVVLKSFPGQTEQNAVERAGIVVKAMQRGVRSLEDLVE